MIFQAQDKENIINIFKDAVFSKEQIKFSQGE
jgi:hypothetical protein